MSIKFGQFLINQKKITEEQLNIALSSQSEEHIDLDQIVISLGKMEDKQLDKVVKALVEEKYAGQNIGEVARALNFISSDDLLEIRQLEEELNNRIGKISVMSGYITQEEIDKCLKEFRELA